MTAKNDYFARKAALLETSGQVYKYGTFDWTTPSAFCLFSGWFYRFDVNPGNPYTGHPHFQRNIGVERYTLIPAGTRLFGTNENSFMLGALPDATIAANPVRYADGEALYYERMVRLNTLPAFQIGQIRPPGNVAADINAYFPPSPNGVILTAITSHGGSWTTLQGGVVPGSSPPFPYIIATQDEINDGHEVRFTNGMETLQPIRTDWFDHIYLGLGTRGDTYGAPHTEATWSGVQGLILPADW